MKKTLLSLLLAATMPAMAQTAVTLPTAPTIPVMVTVSPNATAALTQASTNRVFIDQSGDNPDVNVTQDGSGNIQGSANRPVYLRGIDQTIVTRQIGDSNEINLEVVNDSTGVGKGATVTIQQIGNSNTVDAACGYGTASNGTTALTGCNNLDANWKFTGDSNVLQYRGTGADQASAIEVTGSGNEIYADVIGDKHTQTIGITGDNNTMNITQDSTGAAGSSIYVSLTGTGNSMTMSQSGTVDNVVNITSVSNAGTFNISQTN